MNKIKSTFLPLLVILGFLGALHTGDVSAQWSGGLEGGTVFRDDGSATRLRLKLQNPVKPFSHYIYADWLRTEDGENSYEAGYMPRYWLTEQLYGFGEASLRVDKPLSIDTQQLFIVGAGYQLVATETQSIWIEAGAGSRQTEFLNGSDTDDTLGLLRAGFRQTLSDLLRIELDFDHVDGESLTESTAEAGVAVRIPGGAMKLSYRTRRLEPDGGEVIEDDDSFISFSYGF